MLNVYNVFPHVIHILFIDLSSVSLCFLILFLNLKTNKLFFTVFTSGVRLFLFWRQSLLLLLLLLLFVTFGVDLFASSVISGVNHFASASVVLLLVLFLVSVIHFCFYVSRFASGVSLFASGVNFWRKSFFFWHQS